MNKASWYWEKNIEAIVIASQPWLWRRKDTSIEIEEDIIIIQSTEYGTLAINPKHIQAVVLAEEDDDDE